MQPLNHLSDLRLYHSSLLAIKLSFIHLHISQIDNCQLKELLFLFDTHLSG